MEWYHFLADFTYPFNPIALIEAKIVYNFGLMSAIGLTRNLMPKLMPLSFQASTNFRPDFMSQLQLRLTSPWFILS